MRQRPSTTFTSFKRRSNDVGTSFERRSNDVGTSFERRSNDVGTSFERRSNVVRTLFERRSNDGWRHKLFFLMIFGRTDLRIGESGAKFDVEVDFEVRFTPAP